MNDIKIFKDQIIGKGNFGNVYKGIWQSTINIAAKSLKDISNENEFIKEANIMIKLKIHPNIVSFFGLYKDEENILFIITELMELTN